MIQARHENARLPAGRELRHIPFRDSVLTRILEDGLTKGVCSAMGCVSQAQVHLAVTMKTLELMRRLGVRIMTVLTVISNGVVKQKCRNEIEQYFEESPRKAAARVARSQELKRNLRTVTEVGIQQTHTLRVAVVAEH